MPTINGVDMIPYPSTEEMRESRLFLEALLANGTARDVSDVYGFSYTKLRRAILAIVSADPALNFETAVAKALYAINCPSIVHNRADLTRIATAFSKDIARGDKS